MSYVMLLVIGLLWTAIAIIISEARQRGASIVHFYCFGSLTALFLLLAAGLFLGLDNCFVPEYRKATLFFALAALANGTGQAVSMYNMKKGGRALAYSIPLLAFLLPYVWSLFFWGQDFSCHAAAGLVLIALSVLFLTLCKKGENAQENSSALKPIRVAVALLAMVLIGGGQILMTAPTQFSEGTALSPWTGACVLQFSNAIFFAVQCGYHGKISKEAVKCSALAGLLWGVCAAGVYAILLPTLRLLGASRQAGIVFPVACSMTILLFSFFTSLRFHEKLRWQQWCALVILVAGIFLVKL